jgi:hypothetical protein
MSPEEITLRKKILEEIRAEAERVDLEFTNQMRDRKHGYFSDATIQYREGKIDGIREAADFLEKSLP